MNAEQWRRLAAGFDELCDLPLAARTQRLAELERDSPALAAELREMLAADGVAAGALAAGPFGLAPEAAESAVAGRSEPDSAGPAFESPTAAALVAGERLGPWRVLERLGAGGMGEVWAAERADGAFEQPVAIKLLRRGLETERLIERFLLERRILGRLVHPGIARLLDAGSTADGRPYFVMERVDGQPITRWSAERRLGVERRLELVREACSAVDFAHRGLVVHRDLKPSNVLVDARGQVKLLDFGIAKLIEEETGAERTELEGRALTPAYAAPEQIRGEPVTTATDVYALGVMLYELLTGRLPHRRTTRSWPELAIEVERETVERPSLSARRAVTEPPAGVLPSDRLARRLAGDLDTIVLKALAREPERRYPTAAALAEDLRRHLEGLPITARPDALGYRVGKFVSRHRLAVGAAAAVAAALVVGLAAALWQADRATHSARRAERVRDFLVSVFESRDPDLGAGRGQTVEQLVDESAARLGAELAGEPEVEADLADALARAETSLGRLDRAERLGERALELRRLRFGERGTEVAQSWTTLGAVARARGDAALAEQRLRRALALAESASGADGVEAARARVELSAVLSDQARFAEALEQAARAHRALLAQLGPDHRSTLAALSSRAEAAIHGGDRREAEAILRAALGDAEQRSTASPLTRARLRRELADVLVLTRRHAEAIAEVDRALLELEGLLGSDHSEVAMALHLRFMARAQGGDFEGARGDADRALAILGRIDPDHPLRATLLSDLGNVHLHAGRFAEALAVFRDGLARTEAAFGAESARALDARSNLAHALHLSSRDEEALLEVDPIVGRLRNDPKFGATLLVSAAIRLRSQILLLQGRTTEAIESSRLELACLRARGDDVDPGLALEAELGLAIGLVAAGSPEAFAEARRLAEAALRPAAGTSLPASVDVAERLLGKIEAAGGNLEAARRRFESALAAGEAAGRGTAAESAETRLELGLLLERLGDRDGARRELAAAESLLFRRRGAAAPETRLARAALARLTPSRP